MMSPNHTASATMLLPHSPRYPGILPRSVVERQEASSVAPADCVVISGRMLDPREYEVLQLLCAHGPATVRELLRSLSADPPIAYQTLMTICVRLLEKGLVERRLAVSATDILRYGKAYIYTPLVRDVIELQPIAP